MCQHFLFIAVKEVTKSGDLFQFSQTGCRIGIAVVGYIQLISRSPSEVTAVTCIVYGIG